MPEILLDTEQLADTHDISEHVKTLKATVNSYASNALHQKSASYPILSTVCFHFVSVLRREFKNVYKYSIRHPVTKQGPSPCPSSCVVLVAGSNTIPRFLYECKVSLQHSILQLKDKDVIEALLQEYYCIQH